MHGDILFNLVRLLLKVTTMTEFLLNLFLYKLVQSKIAICHAAVVMYICTELDPRSRITVPEELHLDITESISRF
jgi:hypothetical protein